VRFCDRYIDKRSRTHDQMVQAARSGVQNIAEGSQASGHVEEDGVEADQRRPGQPGGAALDYEDFLRQRGLPLWAPDDPRRKALVARRCNTADQVAAWIREIHEAEHGQDRRDGPDGHDGQDGPESTKSIPSISSIPFTPSKKPTYPEIAANAAHVLIGVATYLLDRQLAAQAAAFEKEGGFTERLYRVRQERKRGP
jgi:four helix bundle suffix protein